MTNLIFAILITTASMEQGIEQVQLVPEPMTITEELRWFEFDRPFGIDPAEFINVSGSEGELFPSPFGLPPSGELVPLAYIRAVVARASVPDAGMVILLTLMLWIMEAGRWSRRL